MPAGAAWNPTAPTSRTRWPDAHLADQRPARRAAADEDVFPFKPQLGRRATRVHLHGRRRTIKRRSLDGIDRRSFRSPPRSRCSAARSRSRTAPLEPTGPQRVDRHRQARSSRRTAGRSRSRRWATCGCCRSAARRCRSPNDAAFELDPAWSPDSTAARVRQRSRRPHGSVGPRPAHEQGRAQLTRERGAVSGPAWSPDGIADRLPRRSPRASNRPRSSPATAAAPPPAGTRRRTRPADVGARTADRSRVGALFPYSNRYREGLEPAAALLASSPAPGRQSVLFPAALRRQPRGRRPGVVARTAPSMAFVTEGRLWTVAVDERGRRDRPARRDRRRISRSRRAGKATRATSSIRRRTGCAASSPTAACRIRSRST